MSMPGATGRGSRAAGLTPRAQRLLADAGKAIARRDLRAADKMLTTALSLAPGHPEILRLLGVALVLVDRPADAVSTLQRARAARPGDVLILNNLGSALRASGEIAAALQVFRDACQRAPTLVAAWFNLAKLLKSQAHTEEACTTFEHVLQLAPEHIAARTGYADTLRALGRIDAARDQYRETLRRKPNAAGAWLGLANIKTHKLDADETQQLQVCYEALDVDDDDRSMIGFVLAAALEHQGRYEQAFSALNTANAARQRSVPWNADEFSGRVDAIATSFDGSLAGATSAIGEEVIFIVSLPRSGSTLIEQIISSHADIEGAGELSDLAMVIDIESKCRNRPFPEWVGNATCADWQRLGEGYLQRTQRWRTTTARFTDKALANWQYLGAAALMLPRARFIDCRRDPVETCLSCYRQWFAQGQGFSYKLESLAAYWQDYRRLMHHWHELWPDRIHIQNHEALLEQPEAEIHRLLDACGLPFDAACIDFHHNPRSVRTASAGQVRQPLRRDTARARHYGALLDSLRAALQIE